MMIALFGAICCALVAYGGGLAAVGNYGVGILSLSAGTIGLGFAFAIAKLSGFTHFVASGEQGIGMADLAQFLIESRHLGFDVFVQTEGTPIRAGGIYTARVNGRDVAVIEAVPVPEAL